MSPTATSYGHTIRLLTRSTTNTTYGRTGPRITTKKRSGRTPNYPFREVPHGPLSLGANRVFRNIRDSIKCQENQCFLRRDCVRSLIFQSLAKHARKELFSRVLDPRCQASNDCCSENRIPRDSGANASQSNAHVAVRARMRRVEVNRHLPPPARSRRCSSRRGHATP
jgi:hypothetical protein